MVSSLFVNLLEKRQTNGRLTAPSNFKLPPRLTMTTTRRETFIRELADPTCPLRKLTRSLPHGIGGKGLLDQCLDKWIPIPRAVWLAKCIGAHDLRAIKRKSANTTSATTSEAKWVKEWTIHVEQFIKNVVTTVKDPNWKAKVDYVLRFAAHLFADRLLEEDHFLDWLLTSLETSNLEQLPFWILLVRIYEKSITSNRRRGQRLTEALLSHLLKQNYPSVLDECLTPVITMIEGLLYSLAKTRPICLLFSNSWTRFRGLLEAVAKKSPNLDIKESMLQIIHRNEHLAGNFVAKSLPTIVEQLISILDTESLQIPSMQLASRCLEVTSDLNILVNTVMRWAASVYRYGRYRIYVAARFLGAINDETSDINELIWNAVDNYGNDPSINDGSLFQIVIELIRSRHFSIGGFLQHLIATGAMGNIHNDNSAPLVRLLKEIPDNYASNAVSNLRLSLLESTGFDSSIETVTYNEIERSLNSQLDQVEVLNPLESHQNLYYLDKLTQTQKFSLGLFVRNKMITIYNSLADISAGEDPEIQSSIDNAFLIARHVLEQIEEFPCLADVIAVLAGSNDQKLLTSLTQTLHSGYKSFIAIGAMKSLFEKLASTYDSLRSPVSVEKAFCASLRDLSVTLNASKSLITQLSQDLVLCDRLFAAMCSPASEITADTPAAGFESDTDFDRILQSGTTMDQSNFERMFKRVTARMEEVYLEKATSKIPAGAWLSRLRSFDSSNYDLLASNWVLSLLSGLDTQNYLYSYVLPLLVGSSCMSLAEFAKLSSGLENLDSSKDLAFRIQSTINRTAAFIPGYTAINDFGVIVSNSLWFSLLMLTCRKGIIYISISHSYVCRVFFIHSTRIDWRSLGHSSLCGHAKIRENTDRLAAFSKDRKPSEGDDLLNSIINISIQRESLCWGILKCSSIVG
jgi:mediator of RNA polymerase II transcription subunit 12, fungi type